MIVHRFLEWIDTATSAQRAEAAVLLAEGYACGRHPNDDPSLGELSMMVLAKDRSVLVRQALAETLADLATAPRAVLVLLVRDVPAVALPVAARCRALREEDLIDLSASGSERVQTAIAGRPGICVRLAAALAEVACAEACAALLSNAAASILERSLHRIAERHLGAPAVREAFLDRGDCPPRIRHAIAEAVATDLGGCGLLGAVLGSARLETLLADAQQDAAATIAGRAEGRERESYLSHLRESGRISLAFLCRTLTCGELELFAATIAEISGQSPRRVEAILRDRREGAVRALLRDCGIDGALAPLVVALLDGWARHAAQRRRYGAAAVTPLVVKEALACFETKTAAGRFGAVTDHLRRHAADAELRDAHARVVALAA